MSILDQLSVEQRLQLVFGQVHSLAWASLTPEGRIVDWSTGAQAMFGWAPAAIVGKPIATIFTPEDIAAGFPDRGMDQARSTGRASDTRWHMRKDGSRIFIDGVLTALHLSDDSLAGYAMVMHDASGTLRLRESEATLRAMINAIPHKVWSVGPDGRAVYVNDRMLAFTGRTIDVLLEHDWAQLLHPDDYADAQQAWLQAFSSGAPFSIEFRFRHHSGEYRWVLCRGEPMVEPASGQIVRWMGTHTDIHEQKIASAKLCDARHRLEETLGAGDIGTWNYDLAADLVYADRNMAQLFGVPFQGKEGLSPALFFGAIHPDDLHEVEASVQRTRDTGKPFAVSFRVLLLDGQVRYIHSRGKAELDLERRPQWFPGVAIDVTPLKLSQEELRIREERYRALFDSIDDGFTIIELLFDDYGKATDHRYLEANNAMTKITGLAGCVGKLSSEIYPDFPSDWREMYAEVLRTGQPVQRTVEVPQWGRWIEFSVTRIGNGAARQLAIFLRDMTKRKHQEEDLQRREERYRALFNSINEGFAVVELEFDAQGRAIDYLFLDVNPALERLTGLRDVVGRTLREVIPQPNLDWVAKYGEVVRTGEPVHIIDYSAVLNAWYDISVVRIGAAHNRQAVLLFTDVTARKKDEEALRNMAAELAQANLRQQEFLATLAHELRNPLAPIRASLDLMRVTSADSLATTKARDIMTRQVDHLVHLVDDLLDLARVTSGKIELKKAPILLSDIVTRAIEATAPLLDARHHRFDYHVSQEPVWLDADLTRLVQVVGNLLTNAAKYTPEHGTITLNASRQGKQAVISISDNGIGIPSEAQPYLFDMFSQVHAGSELAHGGLGIGLSLVKRLTVKHGGTVEVASAGEGCGSTFTLRFPTLEQTPAHANRAIGTGQLSINLVLRPLRILVVDDNADAADMLGQILEVDGHDVQITYDAQTALDKAKAFHPDLAVLDIGMHGMNGFDLARAIRKESALAQIRLIALTGWGTQQDRQHAREAGFDAHLVKPVSIEALRAQVAGLPKGQA
jgi:PAS domain S-box-containing protein